LDLLQKERAVVDSMKRISAENKQSYWNITIVLGKHSVIGLFNILIH
jgi:hypothetical protein